MLKEMVQAQTCGIARINNHDLQVKEFNGQRVVTFKEIDTIHERVEGTAKRNFNTNAKHFIEKTDFYFVKPADVEGYEIRTSEINNSGTYLITESGYLMLVKSLQDDLAWKVQRELVNNYFRVKEQKPTCIEDLIIMQAQSMKDLKQQINQVNNNALEARATAEETKQEIQGIRDVVTLTPNAWRTETTQIINKIAQGLGGFGHIKPIREESYKMLNEEMGVSLSARLLNKKKKMALEGVTKSKIDKVNNLDVIADDRKLISGYVNIIKKLAIKHGIA